jgi:hypothetical protein
MQAAKSASLRMHPKDSFLRAQAMDNCALFLKSMLRRLDEYVIVLLWF